MSPLLMKAVIAITLALIFYTIVVWIIWLIPFVIGMVMGMK